MNFQHPQHEALSTPLHNLWRGVGVRLSNAAIHNPRGGTHNVPHS